MEQFQKLGLSKEVSFHLESTGFETPTEIQEKAIPLALAGRDVIGASSTGSGKTLVFAAPIIENLNKEDYVQALILTPTRELTEQVANAIRSFSKKNLKTLAIYGGVNIDSQIRNLHNADIIVGTPGRILDHLERRTLSLDRIKILVLDECDRMLDMGFRRDVEAIIQQCPKKRQTMLFSATISNDIDYLTKKYTNNAVTVSVNSYVDASKLKQIYYDVPDMLKFSLLVHLLKKENSKLVMVFCNTRRNADFVAGNLNDIGINAKAIHGGLEQNKRIRILAEFHNSQVDVLICTDVAARGLDIKKVTHVYNYDLPKDSKDYIHRIGRTARAGEEGEAINILSSRDYQNFGKIMNNESLLITPKELPLINPVRVNPNAGRSRGRGRFNRGNQRERGGGRGGSDNRRESGRGNGRYDRSNSQGREGGSRYGNSRGRDAGRGRDNSRGRDGERDSGRRNSGGRSYNRNFGRR